MQPMGMCFGSDAIDFVFVIDWRTRDRDSSMYNIGSNFYRRIVNDGLDRTDRIERRRLEEGMSVTLDLL